jgi:lipid II:glycine glycyltransferase (peptidoglycan interpeptide bridge formation enzyme)
MENLDFLQSPEWRKFQEAVGRKTHNISSDGFSASIIEHKLPIVGKYFYIPRGSIIEMSNSQCQMTNQCQNPNDKISEKIQELIKLARKENIGWIRFDPASEKILNAIKNNIDSFRPRRTGFSIRKAPHDVQSKQILVIDITKSEEELLAEMKSKTRYNIKLANKRGVKVLPISYTPEAKSYIDEFLRLTKIMAARQGIVAHDEKYYRKMLEVIPGDILKLYIAEYEGKIIAANLMVFYGDTCVYLHGASDDQARNVMAPYLLQWQAIKDAKVAGCKKYDLGGISINKWKGITRFKLGFSLATEPVEFPGSYDIVISPVKYGVYRSIQKLKNLLK